MSDQKDRPIVIMESPFSAPNDDPKKMMENEKYSLLCMAYLLSVKNYIVIAPHLMWTRHHDVPGKIVPDSQCEPGMPFDIGLGRKSALDAILQLRKRMDKAVFCTRNGISNGMRYALDDYKKNNFPIEYLTMTEEEMRDEIERVKKERGFGDNFVST
jgi:hypothetical protein